MDEMFLIPKGVQKIYLSGAISGLPIEEARAIFNKHEQYIKCKAPYVEVINPLSIGLPPEDASWGEQMINVLVGLNESDAIYMIPGWAISDGALIEYLWAEHEGLFLLGATEEVHEALYLRGEKFVSKEREDGKQMKEIAFANK